MILEKQFLKTFRQKILEINKIDFITANIYHYNKLYPIKNNSLIRYKWILMTMNQPMDTI